MFIFPMAGLSRRFREAGYVLPKYMLNAHGKTLFTYAVSGFSSFFDSTPFLFVVRDVSGTVEFVKDECKKLCIRNFQVVTLTEITRGQAETVACGLRMAKVEKSTPISIFNIDTFRFNFRFPVEFDVNSVDGYLEVFCGEGDNWSYVKPDPVRGGIVIATAEKEQISNLCCTGFYYFASSASYLDAYEYYASNLMFRGGLKEIYVAPIYNVLLSRGADIRYHLIDSAQVLFCGVPSEYQAFLQRTVVG